MIDGIPNRPFYFHQKDIIGEQCDFTLVDWLKRTTGDWALPVVPRKAVAEVSKIGNL